MGENNDKSTITSGTQSLDTTWLKSLNPMWYPPLVTLSLQNTVKKKHDVYDDYLDFNPSWKCTASSSIKRYISGVALSDQPLSIFSPSLKGHADSSLSSFSETPSLQRLPQSEGRWLGDAETPQPTQDVLIQYHCPECTETFFDLECLVQHRQVHSLETNHPDDPSGPLSGQEIVLNPQTPKKWYECDECGKKVLSKRSLLQHQAIHTGEKPYCCDECGMRFALKTYFQYHQMVHSGERPYPCSLCEKTFRGIAALRDVHTDERPHASDKPYPCAECGKRFRTKSNLKSHYSVHSEERPYSCAECGKSFKQRGDLLKHMKIHFIERIWCPTEGRVLIH
uniref:C2H2-type domain-containing protein n=1 Tax=Erpetoichthys calabaricus TaxID=27687 RepID=A0A8C4S8Z8_ERPCA